MTHGADGKGCQSSLPVTDVRCVSGAALKEGSVIVICLGWSPHDRPLMWPLTLQPQSSCSWPAQTPDESTPPPRPASQADVTKYRNIGLKLSSRPGTDLCTHLIRGCCKQLSWSKWIINKWIKKMPISVLSKRKYQEYQQSFCFSFEYCFQNQHWVKCNSHSEPTKMTIKQLLAPASSLILVL